MSVKVLGDMNQYCTGLDDPVKCAAAAVLQFGYKYLFRLLLSQHVAEMHRITTSVKPNDLELELEDLRLDQPAQVVQSKTRYTCDNLHLLLPYSRDKNRLVSDRVCSLCNQEPGVLYCASCTYFQCFTCTKYTQDIETKKKYYLPTVDGAGLEESFWDDEHLRHGCCIFHNFSTKTTIDSYWDNGVCTLEFEYQDSDSAAYSDITSNDLIAIIDIVKDDRLIEELKLSPNFVVPETKKKFQFYTLQRDLKNIDITDFGANIKNLGENIGANIGANITNAGLDFLGIFSGLPSEIENLLKARARGSLPQSISLLTKLKSLDLSSNSTIYGWIPPSICTLTTLRVLDLSNTKVSGDIPEDLRALVMLETLNFNGCDLGKMSAQLLYDISTKWKYLRVLGLPLSHDADLYDDVYELQHCGLIKSKRSKLRIIFQNKESIQIELSVKSITSIMLDGFYDSKNPLDKVSVSDKFRYSILMTFSPLLRRSSHTIYKYIKEHKDNMITYLKEEIIMKNSLYMFYSIIGYCDFVKRLAALLPSNEADLLELCGSIEPTLSLIFDSGRFDSSRALLIHFLDPSIKTNHLRDIISYDSALLNLCIDSGVKAIFQSANLSSLLEDLFWNSSMVQDYNRRAPNFVYMNYYPKYNHGDMYYNALFLPRHVAVFVFFAEATSKCYQLLLIGTVLSNDNVLSINDYTRTNPPKHELFVATTIYAFTIVQIIGVVLYEFGSILGYRNIFVGFSTHFSNLWNIFDAFSLIGLVAFLVFTNLGGYYRYSLIVMSIAGLFSALSLLQYLAISKSLGKLIIMIRTMIVNDVKDFLVVYMVCTIGFVIAFRSLFAGSNMGYDTYTEAILNTISVSLGNFDLAMTTDNGPAFNTIATLVLLLYLVFTAVILLNLLIARMSGTHDKVDEKARQEWLYNHASNVKQFTLVFEQHPFEMAPAPLNIPIAMLFAFLGGRNIRRGISVCGTLTNVFTNILAAPLRIMLEFYYYFHYLSGYVTDHAVQICNEKTCFLLDYEKNYLLKVIVSVIAASLWIPVQECLYRPIIWYEHLVARVSFDTRAERFKIVNKTESESLQSSILKQVKSTHASVSAQKLSDKLKKHQSLQVENPVQAEFVANDFVSWNFIDEKLHENLGLEIPVLTENEVETIFMAALEGDASSKIMKVLVDLQSELRQIKTYIKGKEKSKNV